MIIIPDDNSYNRWLSGESPDPETGEFKRIMREPTALPERLPPPEYESSDYLSNIPTGLEALGRTALALPGQVLAGAITAWKGPQDVSVIEDTWANRKLAEQRKAQENLTAGYSDKQMVLPGVSVRDIAGLSGNMAPTAVAIPAAIAGGVAGGVAPIPGGATMGSMGGAYLATSRLAGGQNMLDVLSKANEDKISKYGIPLTPQEEASIKTGQTANTTAYGRWEGIPETAQTLNDVTIMNTLMGAAKGNVLARIAIAAIQKGGADLIGETISQMGQHNIEVDQGLSNAPKRSFASADDIYASLKEVAAPTFLQSIATAGLMGGAGVVNRKLNASSDQWRQDKEANAALRKTPIAPFTDDTIPEDFVTRPKALPDMGDYGLTDKPQVDLTANVVTQAPQMPVVEKTPIPVTPNVDGLPNGVDMTNPAEEERKAYDIGVQSIQDDIQAGRVRPELIEKRLTQLANEIKIRSGNGIMQNKYRGMLDTLTQHRDAILQEAFAEQDLSAGTESTTPQPTPEVTGEVKADLPSGATVTPPSEMATEAPKRMAVKVEDTVYESPVGENHAAAYGQIPKEIVERTPNDQFITGYVENGEFVPQKAKSVANQKEPVKIESMSKTPGKADITPKTSPEPGRYLGFHGTTEPVFEKFDKSRFGTGKFGTGDEGFYFSADRINAETYQLDFDAYRKALDEWSKDTSKPRPELQKANIYEVELDIKNPKIFDTIEEIEKVKQKDILPHDGAITYDDGFGGKADKPTEMVVFEPEQIKILKINDAPLPNPSRPSEVGGQSVPQEGTIVPKESTVSAPTEKVITPTKTEEKNVVTPKEQKKYLVSAIDDAIREAPENTKLEYKVIPNGEYKTVQAVDTSKTPSITIDVPNDGSFTIVNDKYHLRDFKKMVDRKFPVVDKRDTIPRPSTKATDKRIAIEGVEYYNQFTPRKQELITSKIDKDVPAKTRNFYDENIGWYSTGHYAIKTEKPIGIQYNSQSEKPIDIKRIIPDNKVKAKIVGEFHRGLRDKSGEPVGAHIIGADGGQVVVNASLVDAVLTKYPNAEVFLAENHPEHAAILFKDKGKPVAVISPFQGTLESVQETFADRIKEVQNEKTPEALLNEPNYSLGNEYDKIVQERKEGENAEQTTKEEEDRKLRVLSQVVSRDHSQRPVDDWFQRISPYSTQQRFVKEIGAGLGLDVQYFSTKQKDVGGVVIDQFPKTVFINHKTKQPTLVVLGHETIHTLKRNNKELFDFLIDSLEADMKHIEQYATNKRAEYKKRGIKREMTYNEVREEYYADFAGDQFSKRTFWDRLFEKNQTLAEKVASLVNHIIEKIRSYAFGPDRIQYFKDMNKAQQVLVAVMNKYVEGNNGNNDRRSEGNTDGRQGITETNKGQEVGGEELLSSGNRSDSANTKYGLVSETGEDRRDGGIDYSIASDFGAIIPKDLGPEATREERVQWLRDTTAWTWRNMKNLLPKNWEPGSFFEKLFVSPEHYKHPVFKKIVELFMRVKTDMFHDYLTKLKFNDLTQSMIDLQKSDPKAYQTLGDIVTYGDAEWKKDTKLSLAENMKAFEDHIKQKYGKRLTPQTLKVWKDYRASLDKALDLMISDFKKAMRKVAVTQRAFDTSPSSKWDGKGKFGTISLNNKESFDSFITFGTEERAENHFLPWQDGIQYVMGKKDDLLAVQYIRFDKKNFTQDQAEQWLKDNRQDLEVSIMGKDDVRSKLLQDLKQHLNEMESWRGFYAPRIRSVGRWGVSATRTMTIDGKETVEKFFDKRESKPAADWLAQDLKKKGWTISQKNGKDYFPVTRPSEEMYQGLRIVDMGSIIDMAMQEMGRKDNMSSEDQAKLSESVMNAVSNMMKARGYRGSTIRRNEEHVIGYKTDPRERYVTYARNTSGGLSKSNVAYEAARLMRGERDKEGNRLESEPGIDPISERNMYNTAQIYITENLRNADRADRIIGLARSIATFKYLGLNPRSWIVNMTALVTTVPPAIRTIVTGGQGNLFTIQKEVARAARDFQRTLDITIQGKVVRKGEKLINAEEQAFIDWFMNREYANPQMTREMIGSIQGLPNNLWNGIVQKAMAGFGFTEKINRGSTLLSAYRVAKQNGIQKTGNEKFSEEAAKLAVEATSRAHAEYGKPTDLIISMGSHPFAKVIRSFTTFLKFPHNYLQVIYDTFVRQKDYQSGAWLIASNGVLAGGQALVAANAMFAIMGLFTSRDPEKMFWDYVRKEFGSETEKVGRYGALGYLGVDVSGSLGVGLTPPKNLFELLGAPGGIAKDLVTAGQFARTGQTGRALETVLPTGVANIPRTIREREEGVTTANNRPVFDETGKRLMPTSGESALRLVGFRSSHQAMLSERITEAYQDEAKMKGKRERLLQEYRSIVTRPDSMGKVKDMQTLKDAVKDFNEKVMKYGQKDTVHTITANTFSDQRKRMTTPTKEQRSRIYTVD